MSGSKSSPICLHDDDDNNFDVDELDILSAPERRRFVRRFRQIYEWARTLHQPRACWRDWLSGQNHLGWEFWLDSFESGLPDAVKKLISRLRPPTTEELLEVGWVDEPGSGVYMKMARAEHDSGLPNVLYVGFTSATAYARAEWGLHRRRRQHEQDWVNGDGCVPSLSLS